MEFCSVEKPFHYVSKIESELHVVVLFSPNSLAFVSDSLVLRSNTCTSFVRSCSVRPPWITSLWLKYIRDTTAECGLRGIGRFCRYQLLTFKCGQIDLVDLLGVRIPVSSPTEGIDPLALIGHGHAPHIVRNGVAEFLCL